MTSCLGIWFRSLKGAAFSGRPPVGKALEHLKGKNCMGTGSVSSGLGRKCLEVGLCRVVAGFGRFFGSSLAQCNGNMDATQMMGIMGTLATKAAWVPATYLASLP